MFHCLACVSVTFPLIRPQQNRVEAEDSMKHVITVVLTQTFAAALLWMNKQTPDTAKDRGVDPREVRCFIQKYLNTARNKSSAKTG